AYTLTQMLRGVVERGTGVGARVLGRPIAAKTGTTNDFSNAWFVGYTPSMVAGVWVGHDRGRTLGRHETGARAAERGPAQGLEVALQHHGRLTLDPRLDPGLQSRLPARRLEPPQHAHG